MATREFTLSVAVPVSARQAIDHQVDMPRHVGLHPYFAKQLSIKSAHGAQAFEEVEYVDGIENPAEAFPNIVRWLVKHDYSDGDIGKAIGGNVMRVLEEAWFR